MAETTKLPPFRVRKGEDEEQARKRYIRSLNEDQLKELVRKNAPAAKKRLEKLHKAERKRQRA